jgi:YD repeat-containing protein
VDQPAFNWLTAPEAAKAFTKRAYDGAGRLVTVTDAGNRQTVTGYDGAGRVTSMTSAENRVTGFSYDAAGHRTSVVTPSPTGSGTVSATTTYTPAGMVATESDPHVLVGGQTDPSTRRFDYTAGGRLHKAIDALDHEVTYGYDARGNRSSRTALDDGGTPVIESWTWDLSGRLSTHTVPPPRAGATTQTTTYGYDPTFGRLATVTDPTGRIETRSYYNDGSLRAQVFTKSGWTP